MCGLTGFYNKNILPESTVLDQLQRMQPTRVDQNDEELPKQAGGMESSG